MHLKNVHPQVIEHWRAVESLLERDLVRPAASLTRALNEISVFNFYLFLSPDKIEEWTEHQLTIYREDAEKFKKFDVDFFPGELEQANVTLSAVKGVLGREPNLTSWIGYGTALESLMSAPDEWTAKRYKRGTYDNLSKFVHIGINGMPDRSQILAEAARSTVIAVSYPILVYYREVGFSPDTASAVERVVDLSDKFWADWYLEMIL
ncbi:MAG: hypothetical protein F4X66_04530 [Chloroflexi bacterium]|nr:hypothetical protein [Chloroflexota bacterium]MYE41975.1 hypothetical protein [Chloroflexota bacterium]